MSRLSDEFQDFFVKNTHERPMIYLLRFVTLIIFGLFITLIKKEMLTTSDVGLIMQGVTQETEKYKQ
jgi:hypothetical protein